MKTTVETKTEHLIVLYLLDQEDLIRGLTRQDIADLFGYGHRSSGTRLLRSLKKIKVNLAHYRELALIMHREKRFR